MFRHRPHDQINNFQRFKMADGHHFENDNTSLYLSRGSHDSLKFGADANFSFKNGHVTITNSK